MGQAFTYIQHKRVFEDIIDSIIEQIRSGVLAIGQKLPSERVLSENLGVSRTSLREALCALESMGYIRSEKGGGNYVNSVTLDHILTPFSAMVAQNKQLATDIIEVRRHMEVHMAALAAKHATKEQICRIYGAILDMQAEIERGGNGLEGDNRFHLEIAKASNNQAFAIIVELCYELMAESRKATLNLPGQPAKTIEDHIVIFEAIRDGDVTRAANEMKHHLDKARSNIEINRHG
jgi:GntR family transcriptional repressor for pyruvate dehydrogenase complex